MFGKGGVTAKQVVLLATPPILLVTTWIMFRVCVAALGSKLGYLGGFGFYWLVWCLVLPWLVLGTAGLIRAFRHSNSPFGQPAIVGIGLLVIPLILGYGYAFPRAVREANALAILTSAGLALVNGTLEELLWRSAYLQVFPGSWLFGYAYPSFGFAVWHLAPQAVMSSHAPGGRLSFVLVAGVVGLMWGWVARASGSILWPTLSHVLFDFSGLGGRVYVR